MGSRNQFPGYQGDDVTPDCHPRPKASIPGAVPAGKSNLLENLNSLGYITFYNRGVYPFSPGLDQSQFKGVWSDRFGIADDFF